MKERQKKLDISALLSLASLSLQLYRKVRNFAHERQQDALYSVFFRLSLSLSLFFTLCMRPRTGHGDARDKLLP